MNNLIHIRDKDYLSVCQNLGGTPPIALLRIISVLKAGHLVYFDDCPNDNVSDVHGRNYLV